jgi:hypothetical protein
MGCVGSSILARVSGDPWFVKRRYGYGWNPYAWQGWVMTAVAVALAIIVAVVARSQQSPIWYLAIIAILIVLSVVAATMSGPRPGTPGDADADGPRPGKY